jgi:hypothetical protein
MAADTAYSIRFNRRHGRSGHLVQGRFKAHLIDADAYARRLVRYVHLNPVRPRDRRKAVPIERRRFFHSYPWSSHRAYAGTTAKGEAPDWLSLAWLSFWDDGSKGKARASRSYLADVDSCFGEPLPSPLSELRGGLVLGDETLWKKAKSLLSTGKGAEHLRFSCGQTALEIQRRVAKLIESENDRRVKNWARVRLGGEALSQLARELDYADGSGVHQVIRRLEESAKAEPALQKRLAMLSKAAKYDVDSAEKPRIWADSPAFLKRQWASERRNWGFFSGIRCTELTPGAPGALPWVRCHGAK